MNKVVFHPQAIRDLEEAIQFYKERSPKAARRFLLEFKRAKTMILSFPKAWPLFEKGTRRILLDRFPYGLIYKEHAHQYVILAVMHMSQRPGYWFDRL